MTGLLGGLTALAAGAAFAFGQFEESEKLVNQTNAVLESTGGVANVTAKEVTNLATALMNKAGVDDEVVRNGENVLLTFTNIRNEVGKGNDIFDRATRLTLDLSTAMGQDMKSSAIQVGKALNDPIAGLTSLSRIGVKFDEDTKKQIETLVKHGNVLGAQKLILRELATEFKGSAEAQKTASGTMAVALGELAEKVGKLLAPAITALLGFLTDVAKFIQEHAGPAFEHIKDTVINAWNAVKPFAETIGGILLPLFQTMWNTIKDRLLPVFERIKPLLIVIGGAIAIFAAVVLAQFALVVTAVSFLIDKFLDFVGFIRDKVVEPVGNQIGRIVDFIGKVISWVREHLQPVWNAVFENISGFIGTVIEDIKTLIGWIKTAIGWLSQLGEGVSQALAEKGAAAGVFSGINVGGATPQGGPHPPGAASGGFVARSGLAVIHEGENIIPAGMPAGGGGDVVLQIDGKTFARIARDELLKLKSSRVNLGLS